MKFHLIADVKFEAENIDDAFAKLAEHFSDLAEHGTDTERLFEAGSCEIVGDDVYEKRVGEES